ncbi:uncharacterized protein LOC5511226 isoform X1 [Nematostella vectensis]|uniref:uncharacterized protein LOC5511226 isoform X1 n=1 Tax=Nematostella vectensis TaxID=45351 RepID=UPI002076E0A9|nr:uncharacterized protein LOC5511226 isoform X1 [Nematostella vectensis]XP_048580604.1 uncharacterized protein LOC5511226 isoform X1 [Nematostella vectensis]
MAGQVPQNGRRTADELPIPLVMKGKLRAQFPIPDSPTPSQASTVSSTRGYHYTNGGYDHHNESFPGVGHDYEDISHLQVPPTGSRKHANPVYESTKSPVHMAVKRIRQDTERSDASTLSSDSWNPYPKDSKRNTILLAFIGLLSLIACAGVALMAAGVFPSSCTCSSVSRAGVNSPMSSMSIEPLIARIQLLERNLTKLGSVTNNKASHKAEEKIRQLEIKLKAMEMRLKQTSENVMTNLTKVRKTVSDEVEELREKQTQVNSVLTSLTANDKSQSQNIGNLKTQSEAIAVDVQFLRENQTTLELKLQTVADEDLRISSEVKALGGKNAGLAAKVSELKVAESNLTKAVQSLKDTDATLKNVLDIMNTTLSRKLSDLASKPPPTGVMPTPGSGPGTSFDQCVFKTDLSKGSSGDTFEMSAFIKEETNKVVIGASCSMDGPDENILIRDIGPDGKLTYQCKCRGESSSAKQRGLQRSACYITGWVCPRS